jgi:hypothetical protein
MMAAKPLLVSVGNIPYFSPFEPQSSLMQYLSPTTFAGETLSGPLDKKAIQLGRKKLFAELELSGETTIDLNGKPFTKNDIIKYFDDLLKDEALAWHSAVAADRVLLGFLEQAMLGRKERFENNPLYNDEQFIQWISPYFCHAFNVFMERCFVVEPDEDGLTSLVNNRLLMTPGDTEKAWNNVTRFIMDDIATLERFHAQDKKKKTAGEVTPTQLRGLMEFGYIRMIQLLPKSRFASIRDKYAYCMLNACIDVFNLHVRNRSHAKNWLENAQLLAVSPEVKDQIYKKLEEMEACGIPEGAATGGGGGGKGSSSSGAGVFKLILFLLIIFIKLATCNNTGSTSSFKYNSSPIVYPKIDRQFLDSLIKARDTSRATAPVAPMDTVTFTRKVPRRSKHK